MGRDKGEKPTRAETFVQLGQSILFISFAKHTENIGREEKRITDSDHVLLILRIQFCGPREKERREQRDFVEEEILRYITQNNIAPILL